MEGQGNPDQLSPPSPHGDEGATITPLQVTNSSDSISPRMHDYFSPPPHIAARFHRNTMNMRRKSSATSSRRNSLSSAHSRASSRSRRNTLSGCQSNYIAQHLRRASIIESRKARLADRALHAEQVRSRAALAKAMPRASTSNSEERALAAQLAKEKYLAKVAAACAEEVARAKRIAEEVKERKLAEETRARLEMEERHAEVERRRAEYQRNVQARRARRADSAEKKLSTLEVLADVEEEAVLDGTASAPASLSELDATRRIQKAWRMYLRSKIVARFTDMALHARCKRDSFEETTLFIAENSTISAITGMLTHLGLQDKDDTAALNSRTFLSAYMVTGYPDTVLNSRNGAQEQDLIEKAWDMVNKMDHCVFRLARFNMYTPNSSDLETLSQSYSAYTSAFAAWRLQDSSVLIEGMVASFVELDAIWQTVKDDSRGEVASDYREGIRDNQVMLLSRIRKLAGPDRADTLIKKAIRESRRKRTKKRPTAEVRPRVVEALEQPSSTEAVSSNIENAVDDLAPDDGVEDDMSAGEVQLKKLFTPLPDNRSLTHELAINSEFRLEDRHPEYRDQLYRSICQSTKLAFEVGQGTPWTIAAAHNIRAKLLRKLKPGNSMHVLISDTLDLSLIRRQCEQGVFSYDGFFQFIASVLPRLCAPYRDREVGVLVEELQASSDNLDTMVEKLFKVLRMIDMMSLDYVNFMIMNIAPTLIREAPGYEQRLFAKDLADGVITLERMRHRWQSSYDQLTAEVDRRDPEAVRLPSERPTYAKIYAHALLGTALEHGECEAESLPETLTLDIVRMQKIRTEVLRITVVGAVLLTAKNLLKRDSRSQWKNEAGRMWQLLSNENYDNNTDGVSTAQKAFSILETAHNMPASTKQQISATIVRFFTQAAATSSSAARLTDPVLKVLSQRLRSHIYTRLTASTSSERVRAASSASEALASFGMPEFVTQVGGIVDTLERVRDVDLKAHGMWYEEIFRELQRQ